MATIVRRSRYVRTARILDVDCPDGTQRRFTILAKAPTKGHYRGYVQVNGTTVSGYCKPGRDDSYRFYPVYGGKNTHLVRPASLPVGSWVRIYGGKTGVVEAVVAWNHLTPVYSVRLDDRRHRQPIETDIVVVVG